MLAAYELHDFSSVSTSRGRPLFAAASAADDDRGLSFELHVLDRRLTLDLERYDALFAREYRHVTVDAEGNLLASEGALSCVFKATVREHAAATGAVSLCASQLLVTLHGVGLDAISVQPLDLAGSTPEHVVFRHRDVADPDEHRCGVVDHAQPNRSSGGTSSRAPQQRRELASFSNGKYVGVTVVNDYARFLAYGSNTHRHALQLLATVKSLYAAWPHTVAGNAYTIDVAVASMVTFGAADPYDFGAPPTEAQVLLDAFDAWAQFYLPAGPPGATNLTDVRQLLSGRAFVAPIIGLAFTDGACGINALGQRRSSIVQANGLSDAQISSTAAHELGHNLGMNHDGSAADGGWGAPLPQFPSCVTGAPAQTPASIMTDAQCFCPTPPSTSPQQSIMSASSTSVAHTAWTQCAEAWVVYFMTDVYGTADRPACLEAPGETVNASAPAVCGNGLLEPGEQCDCVNGDCTDAANPDPCCTGGLDTRTACTLKPGRTCSALQACCVASDAACAPAADRRVCRAAASECDIAETCDGVSAACPQDTFVATGVGCASAGGFAGICYTKMCQSLAQECKDASSQFSTQPCTAFGSTCSQVQCMGASGGGCLALVPAAPVANGMPCGTGSACRTAAGVARCVPYDELPLGLPSSQCFNGERDGNETDVDCGGTCDACAEGQACARDNDCFPGDCNATGQCVASAAPSRSSSAFFPEAIAGTAAGGVCLVALVLVLTTAARRSQRSAAVLTEGPVVRPPAQDYAYPFHPPLHRPNEPAAAQREAVTMV